VVAKKVDFPVGEIRRFLEPGPVVLVSSRFRGETNIMTVGWHMVMEFVPSLIGCVIASGNHSHVMIRRSRECVINIPTADLAKKVAGIGNCSGTECDKFRKFGLTAVTGEKVRAPMIAECHANLECRLIEFQRRYDLFIFEVVKAHVRVSPKYPRTIHYRGEGMFMVAGRGLNLRRLLKPGML
jgi:flavin reductase (DIM6/NTAB) family NADH-FMN oxidoreductase RutF